MLPRLCVLLEVMKVHEPLWPAMTKLGLGLTLARGTSMGTKVPLLLPFVMVPSYSPHTPLMLPSFSSLSHGGLVFLKMVVPIPAIDIGISLLALQ